MSKETKNMTYEKFIFPLEYDGDLVIEKFPGGIVIEVYDHTKDKIVHKTKLKVEELLKLIGRLNPGYVDFVTDEIEEDIVPDHSGFYYLNTEKGTLGSSELVAIAKHLDDLNEDWEERIKEDI